MKRVKLVFTLIFIFATTIFLSHFFIVGSGVWGDGQYYYSYVRSLVIDGDLNFRNELEFFQRSIEITKTGMVADKYAIGPAIFWLPFFLLAHLVTGIVRYFGLFLVSFDGYSVIYQAFVGIGSVFFGTLGLWFCYKLSEKFFSKKIALIAILSIWLSSNLFFYTAVDPINSHVFSFFVSSLIIFLWQKSARITILKAIQLGVLVGILAMVRNHDVILAIPLMFAVGLNRKILFFCASVLLGFLPQLFVWKTLFGQFKSPYLLAGEKFNFFNPQILYVWLNNDTGLFIYSPIILLSLIGFYYLHKKRRILSSSGYLLFVLQSYIVSSWHYFSGGASYGGRMFIGLFPFFILGFAGFLEGFKEHARVLYMLLILFLILNFGSIIRFLLLNP